MIRRAGLALALAIGLSGLLAASASAVYFPGQVVDGPSAGVGALGGVTLSRDGGGQVVYSKSDAGVDHVFVSLLAGGAPRQPRRLDVGQATPSTQPRVSSADNGRAAAVWVNGGALWAAVRPNGASDWGSPQVVYERGPGAPAARNPSLSMGASGAAYVAFEAGGDLRYARLAGTSWVLNADPIDIDPAQSASQVDVATSADGTAIAAWSEAGKVWVRRLVRNRLSLSPQEASVPSLDGRAAGGADSPSIDIEDDSSYAWVALRQDFDGGSRVFTRQLVGSEFQSPVAIDGGTTGAEAPALDLTGRGRGLAGLGVRGPQMAMGSTLNASGEWTNFQALNGGSGFRASAVSALSENGRGTIAYQQSDGAGQPSLAARYFNARRFEEPALLTDPGLGPVAADDGVDAAADSGGNQAIAYVQGSGADRRVMVAVYDKEPRTTGGSNFDDWARDGSFKLKWSKIDDPWGAIQYRVEVDGVPLTTTDSTIFNVRDLPDGAHVWNVIATDSRGQATEGPDRALYVDSTAPTAEIAARRSKAGRPANVVLSAFDGEAIAGSGVVRVTLRFGDGTGSGLTVPKIGYVDGAKLGHRYRKPGRYTLRAEIADRAGNKKVVKTRVTVSK